ncbi:MAG: ribosome small subunit-dependent GTPase A [Acidimicrobiia bacterium]
MPDLAALVPIGWNERIAAAAAAAAAHHPGEPGRITRVDRGLVTVLTASGPVRAATGADPLATGDWVLVGEGDESPVVATVLPRHSAFVRGDPMDGTARNAQVVATNIDTVFVTQSFEHGPNLRRLERELVLAFESGAEPVIVLTKADLAADPIDVSSVVRTASGAPVIVTSAISRVGVDELRRYAAPGCTVALIGASGVGKSTLVNCLVGSDVRTTGAVRARDQRGRHTTTSRELVLLPDGGVLVDTPGLRAVTLWVADEGLRRAFADIEIYAIECRFHDCVHDQEPGCAVQLAVTRGEIDAARVLHYRDLGAELDRVALQERDRAREAQAGRRVRRSR